MNCSRSDTTTRTFKWKWQTRRRQRNYTKTGRDINSSSKCLCVYKYCWLCALFFFLLFLAFVLFAETRWCHAIYFTNDRQLWTSFSWRKITLTKLWMLFSAAPSFNPTSCELPRLNKKKIVSSPCNSYNFNERSNVSFEWFYLECRRNDN